MNALEELAERLKMLAKCLDVEDAWKAQRIIAELAKVQPDYVLNGMSIESLSQLENTYANIRAIAEKGAKQ